VVAEVFDECVFTDPTEVFYQQLLRVSNLLPVHLKEARVQQSLRQFSDEQDFQALLEAKTFLEKELVSVRERLKQLEGETCVVDYAVRETQEKSRVRKAQRGAVSSAKKQKA